ncbi:hypothetical protein F4818DRAFT_443765 [Hypoxylon cercidicola]|nr:hypothetical protein F4818DRAFT_443765 [Hypoxylon cercidicola]
MSAVLQLRPLIRARQADLGDVFQAARQAYRYTASFFDQTTECVRFQKVLGLGSSGMVTLWSEVNRAEQRVRDFAVKAPNELCDPYFRTEISWMNTFETAEHFVQPIFLPENVLDSGYYNDPNGESGSAAILIMEYFQRCELNELLIRINESVLNNPGLPDNEKKLEYIPSRILWRLFLCLVRACVGMAYPPPQYYGRPDTYREIIIPNRDPELIIHFDMHLLNVFIDDLSETWTDVPEHGFAPRFKLGDFGLTQAWDPDLEDEVKIAAAHVGKPGYQAPLMYNSLTLYYTDDEDWQPEVCPIAMPDGTAYNLNTWAPFLVGDDASVYEDFRSYSTELRTLIARCMADRQEERPSLHELLDLIQANIARGDATAANAQMQFEAEKQLDPTKQKPPVDIKRPPPIEDDDLLQRFFREYLREPAMREDPYSDYWNER